MHWCWKNGTLVPLDSIGIHLTDLGLRRGYGLFDFMRTYQGAPFMSDYHIEKFLKSAKEELFIDLAISKKELRAAVFALAQKSNADVGITLIATAGSSPDLYTPTGKPELFIYTSTLPPTPEEPIHTLTLDYERPWARTKTFHYFPAMLKLREAKSPRVKEVLYKNREGELVEASRSNLFAVKNKKLITPQENVLMGATRKITLEIAEKLGWEIEKRGIKESELNELDGLFITSTIREILPIIQVDEKVIPVHPSIYTLKSAFHEYVEETTQKALKEPFPV